jgi:hypothetical protein
MTLYEIQRALTHFHELRNIKKFKTPSEAARLDACSLLRHCQKRQTKGSKTKYEKLIRRRRLFFFSLMQSSSCKRFGKYCFRFVSGQVVGFAAAFFCGAENQACDEICRRGANKFWQRVETIKKLIWRIRAWGIGFRSV